MQIFFPSNQFIVKLIWRIFCKKTLGSKIPKFSQYDTHSVKIAEILFSQKFRESNGFT